MFTGTSRADDKELRDLLEQQKQQIEELKHRLDAAGAPSGKDGKGDPALPYIDDTAIKKIIDDYLKENPGAGMPSGVQTGFETGRGFVIRSAPDPKYVKWEDECKIPFELRIRGRLQLDYYFYKVTDSVNHQNGAHTNQNANSNRQADFSQLEVKRARLIFEGNMFDPDLRYHIQLDGNTRGLGGTQNNKVIDSVGGTTDPNASTASPIGGGVTVDHAVRLFSAYVAYDFHPCSWWKGCGPDCPDGTTKYAPTFTLTAGKMKPMFGLEEYLGSANEQFVEYSMADWFFDADDDNLMMMAGAEMKAIDDRLFLNAKITNGNESQFPNTQMDKDPGFMFGWWYDFGGTWNDRTKKWDLFGDCLSDIDYSCSPVVRVGGALNFVPMDRRSLYGDAEQSRVFVSPGAPQGGTRLINLLAGDGAAATPLGSHAVDKFDSYSYDVWLAGKFHGFSLVNEWWFRELNNFHTTPNGLGNIIYSTGGANALFPANHGLFDYGFQLQGGYFVIPKRLELVARWSWIRGDSGTLNGNGTFTTVTIPGVTGPVRVINGAFRDFHEADEYTVGVNYYWKRQQVKWQTDVGVYTGGNPAGGGQSPAGFIAGSDGYLFRTQLQIFF
jgi:hypothetical protein